MARVQGFLVEICYLNGCEPAIDNGGQPVQVAGCGASEGWRKGTLRVGAEHMAHRRLKISWPLIPVWKVTRAGCVWDTNKAAKSE